MELHKLSERTTNEILDCLGQDKSRSAEIARIVEKAMIDVMREVRSSCNAAVNVCCSADQDLAHKIADELHRAEALLISNLQSMR
ncbi:MAG: hypothetical protein RIC16_13995 [Rhodospirillales bacterium]